MRISARSVERFAQIARMNSARLATSAAHVRTICFARTATGAATVRKSARIAALFARTARKTSARSAASAPDVSTNSVLNAVLNYLQRDSAQIVVLNYLQTLNSVQNVELNNNYNLWKIAKTPSYQMGIILNVNLVVEI